MRISAARTLVLPLAIALTIAIALCSAPPGYAGTLRKVPGTYPTIQAAINAALPGDEVVVAPGRYCGSIDFLGKNITVRSSSGNPADTIIDGGENLATVSFVSGESSAAVLRGFTITHGLPVDLAWGIECEASSPTVVGNVIRDNPGYCGGGICCRGGSPTIAGNTVEGNGGDHCMYGAGVYCRGGSPRITGNTIRGNAARSNGGGIYCSSADAHIADNVIENNTAGQGAGICCEVGSPAITGNAILRNTAQSNGGGIFSSGAEGATVSGNTIESNSANWGGGIFWANPEDVDSDSNSITANNITGNVASWVGGGIVCGMSDVVIRGNNISDNSGMEGAGVSCISGSASIVGNTIHHNTSLPGGDGGSVSLGGTNTCAPLVANNTLSHNTSTTGAIRCWGSAKAILCGDIIAFDTSGYGVSVDDEAVPTITYCNVFSNSGGRYSGIADATGSNGNISKDPLFANAANGDFHLKSRRGRWTGTAWVKDTVHSPCIDAGDPSASVGEEPSPNGRRINMGAYGGTPHASKSWQNAAPAAKADSYSTNEDTPLSVASPGVLGNDTDVDGDPLTAIKVANPSHGALTLNANGSFTYTPTANYNGSDSFSYRANDGSEDSNVATVTITVNPLNDAPVAVVDSYSTEEDTALTVVAPGVLANDTDEDDDPLTAVKVSDPAHGSVTLNSDGSFTYTPTPGYDGPDSFTYKANDGAADSNVATVSIDVIPEPPSCKPDAHVYPGPGPAYVGDDIYNTSGDGQTATRTVTSGKRAVFYIKLQNDGDGAGVLKLQSTAGSPNWTVAYYDYSTPGKPEITSQVTSTEGWETPTEIAVGEHRFVEIHVTPASGIGGNSYALTGTLSSAGDAAKTDVVKAVTNCVWLYKPDGHIYPGPSYIGDNIYNTTGAGQTASRTVTSGVRAVYYVKLQNDGDTADKINFAGTAGSADWAVRYYDYTGGRTEITSQVTSASGWTTPAALGVRRYHIVEAHVTPTSGMGGKSFTLTGTLSAASDSAKVDVVKAVTNCSWLYKPDGHVYPGPSYVGNNIYNTTGAGQTASKSVTSGVRAVYYFKLQNDGDIAEKLKFLSTAGNANWAVKYYDYTGGRADITSQVTSASGWTTPVDVAIARYRIVEAHVTPVAGMGGNSFTLTGTVVSTGNPGKMDVVKAVTNCVWLYKPDGHVHPGPDYIGNNIYNTTGAGQTAARTVSSGSRAVYYVKLQNDGDIAEKLMLKGSASSANWSVEYFDYTSPGRPDITTQVTSASGWTTPVAVAIARYHVVEIRVTPTLGTSGEHVLAATVLSSNDPGKVDVVKAVTTSVSGPAPLGINVEEASDDETSGLRVQSTELAAAGAWSRQIVKVTNNGTSSESCLITSEDCAGVFCVDEAGLDITEQMLSGGWRTRELAPGECMVFGAFLMPGSSIAFRVTPVGDPGRAQTGDLWN